MVEENVAWSRVHSSLRDAMSTWYDQHIQDILELNRSKAEPPTQTLTELLLLAAWGKVKVGRGGPTIL